MSNFTFISSLVYVMLLIVYVAFSDGSTAYRNLYFFNVNYIIGTLFLYLSGLKIVKCRPILSSSMTLKKGRLAFFLSVAILNYAMIGYNLIDWNSQFIMNYWVCLVFCILALLTFLTGIIYDRKAKR